MDRVTPDVGAERGLKLIAGTIVAERFRLIRQLGAGGMGAVWLAQRLRLVVGLEPARHA